MSKDTSKKILLLAYFTIVYNIVEGLVSVLFGSLARSTALVGFGLDSFVESLSAGIIIWRFRKKRNFELLIEEKKNERKAVTLISYTFLILGAYVLYDSASSFFAKDIPEPTKIGVAIPVFSIIIMAWLYSTKKQLGKNVKSHSLIADSRQTMACIGLSVTLLMGLLLNYYWDIWWADSIAGIIISLFILKEGLETKKHGKICAC